MATAAPVSGINEAFFQCSVCLDLYKDPKLLPCLHRYCRDCLTGIIEGKVRTFECPVCNQQCGIPADGVDGFKTDFHFKNAVECIELKRSFEDGQSRECISCSRKLEVKAYCFRCNGFLCENCSKFHLTNKTLKDHLTHFLTIEEIKAKNLTLEKLASLTETPRCRAHQEKMAAICCVTCSNLPICIACGYYGDHRGHDLRDVKTLAKEEREKVKERLAILAKYEKNIYDLPKRIEEVRRQLKENVAAKKKKLLVQYQERKQRIEREIKANQAKLKRELEKIDRKEEQELAQLEKEREEEKRKIDEKYDKLMEEQKKNNAVSSSFLHFDYGRGR